MEKKKKAVPSRNTLVKEVAEKTGLPKADVDNIVRTAFETIWEWYFKTDCSHPNQRNRVPVAKMANIGTFYISIRKHPDDDNKKMKAPAFVFPTAIKKGLREDEL